jgi:hypothetical protein
MSQILAKPYDCKGCGRQIRIAKIENALPGKKQWERYELDGKTEHVCNKNNKQQQQQQQDQQQKKPTLESRIDALIAEVQALRKELQQKK